MQGTVLVTGATGRVGGALVDQLIRRGQRVRAAVRTPRARSADQPGLVADVRFDFDHPDTFDHALDGVDGVFLIARPGDDHPDEAARPLVDAIRRHPIRHVVVLTAMGVDALAGNPLRALEQAIETSGVAFTHLRPNFFMQIFAADPLLSGIRSQGVIAVPAGDATLSFIDARDIAEVAAIALTEPGHAGRAYTLTGERALGHAEVADALSRAAARPIRYVALEDEIARELILRSGLSQARADRLLGFYRHVRAGFCAPTSPDVSSVLGRRPTTFDDFARDHASVWRGGGGLA